LIATKVPEIFTKHDYFSTSNISKNGQLKEDVYKLYITFLNVLVIFTVCDTNSETPCIAVTLFLTAN